PASVRGPSPLHGARPGVRRRCAGRDDREGRGKIAPGAARALVGASGHGAARSGVRGLAPGQIEEMNRMSGVDPKLLEILVCPLCKGKLVYRKEAAELICKADRLGYPVKDGIPVMLEEEARKLPPEEEVV